MNRLLQVYIGSERVDLFKDESISITQSIQNVRDIEKVFTSFTKTFSIPASKTNNRIFKHYYNYNIVNGFDARLKVNGRLEVNDTPYKIGKIKLEGVDLKNRKPHTYRITFFGNTVELKDLLGDDKLNDLSFVSYNLAYGAQTVKGRLTASSGDVICPLITHTQRLFYDSDTANEEPDDGNLKYFSGGGQHDHGVKWNELKYAIRVNKIIEEIESRYTRANGYPIDLTFSTDFFKNTSLNVMNDLYLWLHRKSGFVENLAGSSDVETQVDGFPYFQDQDYGVYISDSFASFTSCPQIVYYFRLKFIVASADATKPYDIRIQRGLGGNFYSSTGNTGNTTIDLPSLVTNTCDLFGFQNGQYVIYVTTSQPITFSSVRWEFQFGNPTDPILIQTISTGSFTTSTVFPFNINQQIPDIKTIEFLTGLFKMFNLTAFQDEDASTLETTVIKVLPLDDYYAEGRGKAAGTQAWDISEFVDSTKSTVNTALPYRRIVFQYKDTKTFLANRFAQLVNRDWGEIDYTTGEAELAGQLYKIEVPFSHMQFERLNDVNGNTQKDIQWGYSVNESQNSYKGAPLLFYPVRVNTGGISFVDELNADGEAANHVQISYVNLPSNSVEMPTFAAPSNTANINFNNEINEWTQSTLFTGTLFENYYRTYISDIFDTKKRITKVTAYLPLNIFTKIRLNDEVIINQRKFTINTMTTNLLNGKTDFELLNIV